MDLPKDVFMLYSIINMKLRDEYSSLSDLCRGEDIDEKVLTDSLKEAGFTYEPEINQFR